MALFSFLGGLVGASKAKKASRQAQAAMVDAYRQGIGEQQRQFDTTRADFQPFRETGLAGLGQLGDLIGVNGPDAQAKALGIIQGSPELAALFRNGEEAVLQNPSATGGLRGGNTQRGLADFRSDALSTMIQQQLSRLGGLAGMGMGSTEAVANFGANKSNAITELLGRIGGAKASGALTRGGINSQSWSNAGSFLDDAIKSFLPGGGGIAGLMGGAG